MQATRLLRLAAEEGACKNGLDYLRKWIHQNPSKTAYQFFKSQQHVSYDYHLYFMWCWCNLVDWGVPFRPKDVDVDNCEWRNRFEELNLKLFNATCPTPAAVETKYLALALAEAFKNVRTQKGITCYSNRTKSGKIIRTGKN